MTPDPFLILVKFEGSDTMSMGASCKLREVFKLMQTVDQEMPVQHALALVLVALNPGMTQNEIAKKLNLSTSGVSRIVARVLMDRHGMIFHGPDAHDHRIKRVHLTKKGQEFIAQLEHAIH